MNIVNSQYSGKVLSKVLYSRKIWQGKSLVNLRFLSIGRKGLVSVCRSASRLLIVSTNLDGLV